MADIRTFSGDHPFGKEWETGEEIGKGSYGVVYRMKRSDAGESIASAMKWIPLPGDDAEIRRMYAEGLSRTSVREYYEKLKTGFSQEIQLLYHLRGNSHIVSLEDYKIIPREGKDAIGYDIYIRMELLTPLETWLREKKSISYRDVVRLGEDLCDALTDCSRLSIIHRDIKPDNIFVTDDGRFKLGDFGIARRLERGDLNLSQRVGSLGYMSPEVFHAQPYDLRADIYSLGLVLYRLVNGHRAPFTPAPPAANTPDTANKANEIRLSGKPVPRPEEIPGNLERLWEIIRKACEFYPDDRYRTPEEMKKAFRELEPLTDLDQPVALYSRDQSPEKPGGSDTVMPFTSASFFHVSHHGEPPAENTPVSSFFPAASGSGDKGRTPPAKPPVPPAEPEALARKGLSRKAIWIASIAALAVLCGILCIVLLTGKSPEPAGPAWLIKTDNVTETSVTLSWEGDPRAEAVCSCMQNGIRIRPEWTGTSPLTVSGLVPGKEYSFKVSSGSDSAETTVTTAGEKSSNELPPVQRADLFSVKARYLESESLARVDASRFDYIPDNVLHLRAGPASAQVVRQTVWIQFPSVPESRSAELVMALEAPDGAVFSRSTVLNLSESSGSVTYRAALDELLEDVYTAYRSWPKEECVLRLYLDGLSVFEARVKLENGN